MAKISTDLKSGTTYTPISANVKQDVLYVDSVKAPACVDKIDASLTAVKTSLENMSTILKGAVSKRAVLDNYADLFTAWAKKANTQANWAEKRRKGLRDKFNADFQQETINGLSKRIAELEEKLSKMVTEETNTDTATASGGSSIGVTE